MTTQASLNPFLSVPGSRPIPPLLLDGACGSNLMDRGLPPGSCPEEWILEHPDAVSQLQKEFADAGSNIIYAPTFSANRVKLEDFGLEGRTAEINRRLAELTRSNVGGRALVAGDLSPTGQFCEPFGEMTFPDLVSVYTEQAAALAESGVDLFILETMMSLCELRAAVIACRKFHKPILATITVEASGRTLSGASPLSCLICLQEMGISGFGLNCSQGPEGMAELFRELAPYAKIPLIAKPNAGMPDENGRYPLSPEEMAAQMRPLLEAGVTIIGGCCGNTPAHIAAMRRLLDEFDFDSVHIQPSDEMEEEKQAGQIPIHIALASEQQAFFLTAHGLEASEPVLCSVDMADDLLDVSDTNADVILVQISTTDDAYQFGQNAHMSRLPILFHSDSAPALRAALLYYHGRAMVDQNCDIPEAELRAIAQDYGAVVY